MTHTHYTSGFEKFWQAWIENTSNYQGKKKAFEYWKRDKLESETGELIEILLAQVAHKKKHKDYSRGCPCWPYCRKWLNEEYYSWKPHVEVKQVSRCRYCGNPATSVIVNTPVCHRQRCWNSYYGLAEE